MHVRGTGTAAMALLDISSKALALCGGKPISRGQESHRNAGSRQSLCTAYCAVNSHSHNTGQGRNVGLPDHPGSSPGASGTDSQQHQAHQSASRRTLSHGHTASVFSALTSTGWPRRQGWACWDWVLRVPASQVFPLWGNLQAHSQSSSVSGLDHPAFPSSLPSHPVCRPGRVSWSQEDTNIAPAGDTGLSQRRQMPIKAK